ncbi:thyroglobulin-like [Myxocyprinus asiaticus]|uniref:thyroglobulin-like n=1 Tax=Myxocyprinus asiaticus TaxID=70543 RepID=UPI002223143B|nr:thyroglobulin-like [Myxocyprinus asiaticus]
MQKMGQRKLLCVSATLLNILCLTCGKISEYQLDSESLSQCEKLRAVAAAQEHEHIPQCSEDGRFSHAQCNRGGGECWCVNAQGLEIPGSRQNRSTVHCLTSCQLQRQRALRSGDSTLVPVCLDSGEYEQVQCDASLGQCWCVDQEGMEIYGTRQNGRPSKCPGVCEVRQRRLLHGIGEPSPPQCSDDGGFLPVQCKFVNTTDRMVFDLLHTFNKDPEVFQTFSGFRKAFPELSSYCFCADSRGREMPHTGVELLLDEVYDTAFSDQTAGSTFSQSNMYRILQRRYLAVQLAVSGRFRCPTQCESERAAATQAGNFVVPSCTDNGGYVPTQCQSGGQCWCVDTDGKEIFGTRQYGVPQCSTGVKDCLSERRQAISRLFYGPAGDFSKSNVFSASKDSLFRLSPCSPEFQELLANSGLLQSLPELERPNVGDILAEFLQGMFPSGALALKALALAPNPKRLQENLFGGKFLKNAGNFNFSGTLGTSGTLSFSQVFSQVGLTQGANEFMQLAKMFSNGSASLNLDQEISDAFGRSVNLKNNQDMIKIVSMTLENQQFLTTLLEAIKQLKAEESTQLGQLFRAIFLKSQSDVCKSVTSTSTLYMPQCTEDGRYEEVQCQGSECWCVDSRGLEIMGSRSTGLRPRCPSQCEKERQTAIAVKASSSAGSEVFIPKCEVDGAYVARQCLGKSCFCVDRSGAKLNIQSSGSSLQCPTSCQATATQQFLSTVHSILSDPSSVIQFSEVYIPHCASDGSWHQIQCDGPSEQAIEFYHEWIQIISAGKDLPVSEVLGILQAYARNTDAMISFRAFASELFKAGHHKVFPALAKFEKFSDLPADILGGNFEAISGPSVFLNPLSLWRLIRGEDSYPGVLSDFSAPIGSFHLRQCWCVNPQGDILAASKAPVGQIPKCPGPCTVVHSQVSQFLKQAEELISASNSSHIPVGYSFLQANSIYLTPEELEQTRSSEFAITQALLSSTDSALRLAAHSTLHFYWQSRLMVIEKDRQSLVLGYQPYIPQCDAYGQWLPSQCHPSTGHCWCVDGKGTYIMDSLTTRSTPPQQCQTTCQRLQSHFLLSDWTQTNSNNTHTYSPSCNEDGEFSLLQKPSAGHSLGLCVSPVTGQVVQPAIFSPSGDLQCPGWCALQKTLALQREVGVGYEPECVQDGHRFSPLQCDLSDCWCVSQSGKELPATRTPRNTGKIPACDIPECSNPFGKISHGTVLCGTENMAGQQRQRCKLYCDQGYINALSVTKFLCDPQAKNWLNDAPLSYACQRPQALQTVQVSLQLQLSLAEGQQGCSTQIIDLQTALLRDMKATGLCSLQLSSSGKIDSVVVCDESSVSLECLNDKEVTAHITFRARLSDMPMKSLPDLHDIDKALSEERLLKGVKKLIRNGSYQSIFISDGSLALSSPPSFSCLAGYKQLPQYTGCVLCPAGSFSSDGVCTPCPHDTFQAEEGQIFCTPCPSGTSTVAQGALNPSHCLTKCQQSNLSCTEKGDFLLAQKHPLFGKWLCVTPQGEELSWTSSDGPMTVEECEVMEKFAALAPSSLLLNSENADVLSSDSSTLPMETQLRKCLLDCALEDSCQHVAIFTDKEKTHCELYSTSVENVECKTAEQSKGFLGNDGAEMFQTLNCVLKIRGGDKPNLIVLRKKGHEFSTAGQKSFKRLSFRKASSGVYRTLVFDARRTTLADVHRFCVNSCSSEDCCDGFILNQNVLSGGSIMCGLLSSPSVLQCSEKDWDVSGMASSNRICGAGVQYNKQQKRFTFNFGEQNFTITDAALPASSKNTTGYQETLISFQRVYLWKESDMSKRPKIPSACSGSALLEDSRIPLSDSVKEAFGVLEIDNVNVDPERNLPSQLYWIFKHQYTFQQAQLWCLKRCEEEELCHVSDIRDEGPLHFVCVLYPDTQVCGAYDKPLRQACSLVLAQSPQTAYQKKVSLTGSVKSFYSRIPFKKMVSYSVRSRVSLSRKSITEGFFECERRCDKDPCCRGIGYVRDSGVPGSDVLCLTLNSLGIQTCGENDSTNWRTQDCSPSKVQTEVYPFGWYEKPVNQWTTTPSVCPRFSLRSPSKNTDMKNWKQLDATTVQVDSSVAAFDIVHISRDIAEDQDKVREWCLSACEESESCSAVSIDNRESAMRCVMYPDTHTCIPTTSGQRCLLIIKEPAQSVYIRTGLKTHLTSVSIPDHGTLFGESEMKSISGSDSKRVTYFLGVPYARPPIGELRFSPPQPANWTGTWNATFYRFSCLQPGDTTESSSSEDCLYLNVFVPSSVGKDASVLLFFHNSGSGVLDGSYLAAVGNIIVVKASFRVAAFGFLSAGSTVLPGNYGLQDQAAVLGWVQKNIALFGGDPTKVTLGAERNGADIASLHLTSPSASSLFRRALLMGGSVFSPAVMMSTSKAQAQAASLARELDCSPSDIAKLLICLRSKPAQSINAAQTKLLAVSGPLQAWLPVVDGTVLREKPVVSLQSGRFHRTDLLLGSSVEDGLISRAKHIKNFEQLQGRADSKTAFYEALSNSLGGDDANAFVKEAATWFYSLQHSPSPSGYNVFSRALENATRDLFIICPAVDMAEFWATNTQSSVYLYHLPEDTAHNSVDLSTPMDVLFLFGVPLAPEMRDLFSSKERTLTLQIMNYMANFIKSGNPNLPLAVSRTSFSKFLPPWPQFMPHSGGRGYKELSLMLSNRKNLQSPQCSFWSQYVRALITSTAKLSCGTSVGDAGGIQTPTQGPISLPKTSFFLTPSKPKSEKDAYS